MITDYQWSTNWCDRWSSLRLFQIFGKHAQAKTRRPAIRCLSGNRNPNFEFLPSENRRQVQRGLSSSSSDALFILFVVYPERSEILLQFLHHFTAHSLPFSVTCQHRPQHFAQNSAVCKTHTQQFPLRSRVGQLQKHIEFFYSSSSHVLDFQIQASSLAQNPKTKSH